MRAEATNLKDGENLSRLKDELIAGTFFLGDFLIKCSCRVCTDLRENYAFLMLAMLQE